MRAWLVVLAACGGSADGRHVGNVYMYPEAAGGIFDTVSQAPCEGLRIGSCIVPAPCIGGDTIANASAGEIDITGGTAPLSMFPDSGNSYAAAVEAPPLYTGGTELAIAARGAEVPAFHTSLKAPRPTTITAPQGLMTIDHTEDFSITWSGGSDTVALSFFAQQQGGFSCLFEANAGKGTVPKEALARLPLGQIFVGVFEESTTELDVDVYAVTVTAQLEASWPNGPENSTVILQ